MIDNEKSVLSAIDVLHAAGSTWRKDPAGRAAMTLACHDADYLPRVRNAGNSEVIKGVRVQIMHNGIVVKEAGYQGEWEAKIIEGLRGVHEPQEEKVFYEVLKRIKPGGMIIELGSWWCYYSMWFLKSIKNAKAICCEPDPENIKLGKLNMELNTFTLDKEVTFYEAAAGSGDKEILDFTKENGEKAEVEIRTVDGIVGEKNIKRLDILHVDIQGAELEALRGAEQSISKGVLRFVFVSTHHYSISGDPTIHQKCKDFIEQHGGVIIAEHSILESCSGDGLIVASFSAYDKDFHVEVSRQPSNNSLFRSAEEDVSILWANYNNMLNELARLKNYYDKEIEAKNDHIVQLERTIGEITPLRRHIKRFIRFRIGEIDRGLTKVVTRKNNFKPHGVDKESSDQSIKALLQTANESDQKNFASYNTKPTQPLLPAYKSLKRAAHKAGHLYKVGKRKISG